MLRLMRLQIPLGVVPSRAVLGIIGGMIRVEITGYIHDTPIVFKGILQMQDPPHMLNVLAHTASHIRDKSVRSDK